MGVPTYSSIANANDIRETAISVFQVLLLLADSTGAAHCDNREFGTSRWQLSMNATRNCCGAGAGCWPVTASIANGRRGSFVGDCVAKVESCRATNFRENQKREAIADSYSLNRATEVAYEFNVWR
jgi:hypothetical protein